MWRLTMLLLCLIAAFSGTPLRQAEAASDFARSRSELGQDHVETIDGGVGEGMLGRVQVFAPGDDSACLECTWGDADYRQLAAEYPCQPGAAVSAPATVAPACVGAVVAGIMAARWLYLGEARRESREIAFDLRHNRFLESRLRRSPRCRFDHQIVAEVVTIAAAMMLRSAAKNE